MLNEVLEINGKAIYIAPTRSLALERYNELCKHLAFEGNGEFRADEDIIISTGEASKDDWRLHRNRFRIAVFVNEKLICFKAQYGVSPTTRTCRRRRTSYVG